jgi:hypothetical protein
MADIAQPIALARDTRPFKIKAEVRPDWRDTLAAAVRVKQLPLQGGGRSPSGDSDEEHYSTFYNNLDPGVDAESILAALEEKGFAPFSTQLLESHPDDERQSCWLVLEYGYEAPGRNERIADAVKKCFAAPFRDMGVHVNIDPSERFQQVITLRDRQNGEVPGKYVILDESRIWLLRDYKVPSQFALSAAQAL